MVLYAYAWHVGKRTIIHHEEILGHHHFLGKAYRIEASWLELRILPPTSGDLPAIEAGGQDEGLGAGLPHSQELVDGALKIPHALEDAQQQVEILCGSDGPARLFAGWDSSSSLARLPMRTRAARS